jgi:hypothetical protein
MSTTNPTPASIWTPTELEPIPTQALKLMATIANHAAEMAETLGDCAHADSYRDTALVLEDEARSRERTFWDDAMLDVWGGKPVAAYVDAVLSPRPYAAISVAR